jgi:Domain of unknown function (DUF4440)
MFMKSFVSAIFATFVVFSSSAIGSSTGQAPAAAPPVTSAESPEIRDLQKVEDNWSNALNQRDQYGLELVLSPLFINVSSSGDITSRNQQVVALINQEDKTASTDMHVVTVRMLGDVAVANGTYSYTHKVNGAPIEERGIFTHVFQRVRGNWVCLNAQRTLLREDGVGKNKSKANSKAELPFHIPLFSKGDKSDKQ